MYTPRSVGSRNIHRRGGEANKAGKAVVNPYTDKFYKNRSLPHAPASLA